MLKRRRKLSRRELLELAAATGALSLLPISSQSAGSTPTPPECTPVPTGDEAEVIGSLLWDAFKLGAEIQEIPCEIEEAGRELSGDKIRGHLGTLKRKGFPYFQTANCAFYAGQKAAEFAAAGGRDISEQDFREAWKYVRRHMDEAIDRLCKNKGIKVDKGGAC